MTCKKENNYEVHSCSTTYDCNIDRSELIQEIDLYSNLAVDLLKQMNYTKLDEKTWLSPSGKTKVNIK